MSWPSAVDDGLHRLAASESWQEGYGQPVVRVIAGKPYWVLTFGDTDTSNHATAQGGPVGLHCVHVYAAPAEPDFGQYIKVNPYRFGWWLKWPERAVDCKSFSVVAINGVYAPNPFDGPTIGPPEADNAVTVAPAGPPPPAGAADVDHAPARSRRITGDPSNRK